MLGVSASERLTGTMSHVPVPKDRQLRKGGMGLAREADNSCVTGMRQGGDRGPAREGPGRAARAGRAARVDDAGGGRWPQEDAPATLAVYAYARRRPPPGHP